MGNRPAFVRGLITGMAVSLIVAMVALVALPGSASNGDPLLVGKKTNGTRTTKLIGRHGLEIRASRSEALKLYTQDGVAPMRVNQPVVVDGLNADMVDGIDAAAFHQVGYPLHYAGCPNCTALEVNAFGAHLPGLDLDNASISAGAVFSAADLTQAILTCGMPGAHFEHALLQGAIMDGAWMTQGMFQWANLSGASMIGADLTGASFFNADLTGADLTDADLSDGILTGAVLTGVTWSNTTCPDTTNTDTNGDGDCDGAHRVH
jgi:hypothetical protein